jgi:cytochrome c-type biogenesis protein CcmH/NrfG
MKTSRKKWVLLAVFAVLTGAFSLFLLSATSRTDSREAARAPVPRGQTVLESPDHELKALAMQLRKKPGHTPVLMRMAQLERESGKLNDAAGHLREAVKSEPSNLDARVELGRVLYEGGDVDGAIAETEKVLASNPGQVDALYNLGAIHANLGDSRQARAYWAKAVEADSAADSGRKAREALAKLGGS